MDPGRNCRIIGKEQTLIKKIKPLIHRLIEKIDYLIFPIIHERYHARILQMCKEIAYSGKGSDACLKEGFLPVPVHFYSPIPDIDDLKKRRVWDVRSSLAGIDFRPVAQLDLLQEFGSRYGGECRWPLLPTNDPFEFHVQNQSFSYGCAASTHCMIRQLRPGHVIEIGSGMSSRVIAGAINKNLRQYGQACEYTIVDPYPGEPIRNSARGNITLIESRVELLDPALFSRLGSNDILFIDSSHSVKIGGDVNYLFLEVLPRLAPGVVIHIHDIALPFEYDKAYATNEAFRQFWTEQYLLQSFMSCNNEFIVLLALSYLMTDHMDAFKEAFKHYDPTIHLFNSGSFWIQRNP
jgi:hypothetical protein